MLKYNREGDLLFSCAKDDMPTLWQTATGQRLGTYDGHNGTVWALDPSQDSMRLLTAGGDQTVKLWVVESGKLLVSFTLTGPVRHVEWAEGDEMFVAISDPFPPLNQTMVRIYSRVPGSASGDEEQGWEYKEWTLKELAGAKKLTRATWAPCNEFIITGDEKGVIRVHEPDTGKVVHEVLDHSKKINSFQWNKDKTLLITGSADCSSKLFDVNTWRCLRTYDTEVPVNSAAISPIKEHVFVAGGQEAMAVTTTSTRVGKFETKLFHMVFGDEFGSIRGHFGPVNTIAIAPDGCGFTSGSEDGYIRIHVFDKDYFKLHTEFDNLDELRVAIGGGGGGSGRHHAPEADS